MEAALDSIVNVFGVVTLTIYAWSVHGHFKADGLSSKVRTLTLSVMALAFVLVGTIWASPQPVAALAAGILLMAASLSLFLWAISVTRQANLRHVFDEERPVSIVQVGPYRYVRHPFYSSYITFWIAWSIASWSAWSIIPTAGLLLTYALAARAEEHRFDRTSLADDYRAYMLRTGRFFPKISGWWRRNGYQPQMPAP